MGFVVDGAFITVHKFHQANIGTTVYMRTPNLPLRWEIEVTGAPATGGAMDAICCAAISEGGQQPSHLGRTRMRGDAGVLSSLNVMVPVMSLRLQAAYNRAPLVPTGICISSFGTDTDAYQWSLRINPTIVGGTAPSWTALPNSFAEYDIAQDGVVDEDSGTEIAAGYGVLLQDKDVTNDDNLTNAYTLVSDYAGTSDVLVLAVKSITGNFNYVGGISWIEFP